MYAFSTTPSSTSQNIFEQVYHVELLLLGLDVFSTLGVWVSRSDIELMAERVTKV